MVNEEIVELDRNSTLGLREWDRTPRNRPVVRVMKITEATPCKDRDFVVDSMLGFLL